MLPNWNQKANKSFPINFPGEICKRQQKIKHTNSLGEKCLGCTSVSQSSTISFLFRDSLFISLSSPFGTVRNTYNKSRATKSSMGSETLFTILSYFYFKSKEVYWEIAILFSRINRLNEQERSPREKPQHFHFARFLCARMHILFFIVAG